MLYCVVLYEKMESTNNEKLDSSKSEWIIKEKRKNTVSNKEITAKINVIVRWVQKLHKRYKDTDKIVYILF